MKRLLTLTTMLCTLMILFTAPTMLQAVEIKGVNLPDKIAAGDADLSLNGAGIRKKLIISVYVAGLYLPERATEARAAIETDVAKQIRMVFVYKKVGREKMVEAWNEGFFNNSQERLNTLQERLDRFNSWFDADMHKGDEVVLTYRPGNGTTVSISGSEKGTIPGADFMTALWAVWLGDNPADQRLKEAMLGGGY
ncbi:MAG: chalcone isomerase family protein [Deltaproteobacteria bacterium]|nr:chalcone isomerase family protein [Candidatus Anaeroferrophillacea bacterium]